MEISKALGGMRYDEAVLRLRSMGQSELDFKPSEHAVGVGSSPTQTRAFGPSSLASSSTNPPKRSRSVSNGATSSPVTRAYAAPQLMKPELATLPTGTPQVYGYENPTKTYGGAYTPVYGVNGIEYVQSQPPAEYEHLAPAPFADEEGFGELLQNILEDDPRVATGANMGLGNQAYAGNRYGYYTGAAPVNGSVAPLKRTMSMPSSYAMTPSMLASPPRGGMDQEYFADPSRRASLNLGVNPVPSYVNYQQSQPQQQQPQVQQYSYPHQQEQQQPPQGYSRVVSMAPPNMATATSTSFS
ncbi:hypothetical protein PHYBOEH_007004 [Phytophthora boehmeriae]|uniref:Uncharacterized protein n=1 Tax=Phytophthora boehmeriae TaxID=109152 RepID=A0A8T1X6Y6_9STRA|nr:hypothetical protein PHYBOEH_007004 [Phytophthora boehmeriae]